MFKQDKIFRSLEEASITFKEQFHTLQATENKRKLIYDSENKLIGTIPFNVRFNELINK